MEGLQPYQSLMNLLAEAYPFSWHMHPGSEQHLFVWREEIGMHMIPVVVVIVYSRQHQHKNFFHWPFFRDASGSAVFSPLGVGCVERGPHHASEGPGVTLPSVQIAAGGVRFQRAAATDGAICTPREAEGYGR